MIDGRDGAEERAHGGSREHQRDRVGAAAGRPDREHRGRREAGSRQGEPGVPAHVLHAEREDRRRPPRRTRPPRRRAGRGRPAGCGCGPASARRRRRAPRRRRWRARCAGGAARARWSRPRTRRRGTGRRAPFPGRAAGCRWPGWPPHRAPPARAARPGVVPGGVAAAARRPRGPCQPWLVHDRCAHEVRLRGHRLVEVGRPGATGRLDGRPAVGAERPTRLLDVGDDRLAVRPTAAGSAGEHVALVGREAAATTA